MRSRIAKPSRANREFDPRFASARAVLVVDHDMLALMPFLADLGFLVLPLTSGMNEDGITHPSMTHEDIGVLLGEGILPSQCEGSLSCTHSHLLLSRKGFCGA
jgi:hypothetical protein